ncbi:hypothetical protein ABW11_21185 [Pluralibacter gergoviae]|uniref:hypothetical protein n=1 Tax=Pluralibacter gergoviae TaxID=61647 RepID=UPI0006510FE0|nr:hypothetical protein [Pluralibacter gergoviae]KMK23122.1 hypothetical protein ABW11_21185 [Pluralibacter gergoviae]
MNNLTLIYRRRILKAALLRHQRKTGSHCIVIGLPHGGITTLELTEIVMDGILVRFENIVRKEHGNLAGDKAIRDLYLNAVDVNCNGEFLTYSGKLLVDELVAELIAHAKEKYVSGGVH